MLSYFREREESHPSACDKEGGDTTISPLVCLHCPSLTLSETSYCLHFNCSQSVNLQLALYFFAPSKTIFTLKSIFRYFLKRSISWRSKYFKTPRKPCLFHLCPPNPILSSCCSTGCLGQSHCCRYIVPSSCAIHPYLCIIVGSILFPFSTDLKHI